MYYSGFADEAGKSIDIQIKATKELGWINIESRGIDNSNLAYISEGRFEEICRKLSDAGISINCYGSGIANWSKDPRKEEDFQSGIDELKRVIPRMHKLGIKMLRGMSFTIVKEEIPYSAALEKMVYKKVTHLVKMCEDAGIIYLHENCMNYGGMSFEHTLKLLDNVRSPNFKLVFDTGNPVAADDIRGDRPYRKQNAFEFYRNVKEYIHYVHIKDGVYICETDGLFAKADYCYPGEGEGCVKEIITDLLRSGYDGGFSIEPHMKMIFHDSEGNTEEEAAYKTYIEYGRRFMGLVNSIK